MLKVQEFLKQNSLEKLKGEFGISVKPHDTHPLVILDYCQINSPKTHPIVMECRGLVLELDTWKVVSKGYDRFFNVGEALEITNKFNWNDFYARTKEDGSYIHVFNYNDQWLVKTRNSFAQGKLEGCDYTWEQLFWETQKNWEVEKEPKGLVFIFELCSVYNKVVRHYSEPKSYLLGIYDVYENILLEFFKDDIFDFCVPQHYYFKNLNEVENFIKQKEEEDKTFEGLVLTDSNGLKLKIKSRAYLALHRLKGNGNIFLDKNLVPLVLSGETDEVISYYPEIKESLHSLKEKLDCELEKLITLNYICGGVEDQKRFAMTIKHSPFSSILFSLRKIHGTCIPESAIRDKWRDSEQLILKWLEG